MFSSNMVSGLNSILMTDIVSANLTTSFTEKSDWQWLDRTHINSLLNKLCI